MSSKNGAKQSRKGNGAQKDVRSVLATYVSSTPMGAPTRLRCLDWNAYVRGLKMMVATMRDREKSALASQATMYDALGISASVLENARARESGRHVSGSVL
jgi:hypothetical protein